MCKVLLLIILLSHAAMAQEKATRGRTKADHTVPNRFPHRIWAASDFEGPMQAYHWFGPTVKTDIPEYPGNTTAMGVGTRPYKNVSAIMTGINPVPGPRMGTENWLYLRYKLKGTNEATFQHFSLTSEDNNHVVVSELAEDKWAELKINFSKDGRRNDGSPGVPFKHGERMDDLKIFAGKPDQTDDCDLVVDDIVFFANEPGLKPETEPFPNRVIWLAGFDTGLAPESKPKYWPGRYDIVHGKDTPEDSWWGVARAVVKEQSEEKLVAMPIDPPRQVGAHTKLRFRYHLHGATDMTVQIFDATVQDNRHVRLTDLSQDKWHTQYVDFSRDSRRNDGTPNSAFNAGHLVDELFFFVDGSAELHLDEVVLFDARKPEPSITFVSQWGSKGDKPRQFHSPIGIAIDKQDHVYVTDLNNARLQKFDSKGNHLGGFDLPHDTSDRKTSQAGGIAVSDDGLIYLSFMEQHKIRVYTDAGELRKEWGSHGNGPGEFKQPGGVVIVDGKLVVADQGNHRVQVFTTDGEWLQSWGEHGIGPGQFGGKEKAGSRFGGPHFIATDSEGRFFTTEGTNGRVQRFSPNGIHEKSWGHSKDDPGGFGALKTGFSKNPFGPIGVMIDSLERVWISSLNDRVQAFTTDGEFLYGIGSSGENIGQFSRPHGMAMDSNGYLYVVDASNHRIQKFSAPSSVTK